jgi:hypothetical protein
MLQEHWENTCWQPQATPLQTLRCEEDWQQSLESIHKKSLEVDMLLMLDIATVAPNGWTYIKLKLHYRDGHRQLTQNKV